jgi:hypothetical protein
MKRRKPEQRKKESPNPEPKLQAPVKRVNAATDTASPAQPGVNAEIQKKRKKRRPNRNKKGPQPSVE